MLVKTITMPIIYYLFSKWVNWHQGMVFRVWAHKQAPLSSQWVVLKIDGIEFLHCYVADSI